MDGAGLTGTNNNKMKNNKKQIKKYAIVFTLKAYMGNQQHVEIEGTSRQHAIDLLKSYVEVRKIVSCKLAK